MYWIDDRTVRVRQGYGLGVLVAVASVVVVDGAALILTIRKKIYCRRNHRRDHRRGHRRGHTRSGRAPKEEGACRPMGHERRACITGIYGRL